MLVFLVFRRWTTLVEKGGFAWSTFSKRNIPHGSQDIQTCTRFLLLMLISLNRFSRVQKIIGWTKM